jgi:hypothetical protein
MKGLGQCAAGLLAAGAVPFCFDPVLAWHQHAGWSQASASVDASLVDTAKEG